MGNSELIKILFVDIIVGICRNPWGLKLKRKTQKTNLVFLLLLLKGDREICWATGGRMLQVGATTNCSQLTFFSLHSTSFRDLYLHDYGGREEERIRANLVHFSHHHNAGIVTNQHIFDEQSKLDGYLALPISKSESVRYPIHKSTQPKKYTPRDAVMRGVSVCNLCVILLSAVSFLD